MTIRSFWGCVLLLVAACEGGSGGADGGPDSTSGTSGIATVTTASTSMGPTQGPGTMSGSATDTDTDTDTDGSSSSTAAPEPNDCRVSEDCNSGVCAGQYVDGMLGPFECQSECIENLSDDFWCADDQACCREGASCNTVGLCVGGEPVTGTSTGTTTGTDTDTSTGTDTDTDTDPGTTSTGTGMTTDVAATTTTGGA